jgi:hypothetical protein
VVQIVAAATAGSSADIFGRRSVDGFTAAARRTVHHYQNPAPAVLSTAGCRPRQPLHAAYSLTVEALTQAGYNVKSFTPMC